MFKGFKGFIFICIIAALLGSASAYAFYQIKNISPEKILNSSLVQEKVNTIVGDETGDFSKLLPQFLGFDKPRTYLFLFQNNTEMRPGGGFIGLYSTLRVDKGKIEVLKVEGTETIDRQTPADWKPTPLAILQQHLGVDRWYFRDSNWSPDFAVSADKALELYTGENGIAAKDIDTVVAFTPTVLERLMKITGPFVVEGIEFTSENVTETLEYHVEYDYARNGRSFEDRKGIVKVFMDELLLHLKENAFARFNDYTALLQELASEKHIIFYSKDPGIEKVMEALGWTGKVKSTSGDYLLYVDANLAALKTDHAMKRELTYTIEPRGNQFVAKASMKYTHTGVFDWRTSRYRTYARVYVPRGSQLLETKGAMKWDRSKEPGVIDQGEELGKQWFGTFIAIEPGQTGTLEFVYTLPASITEQINQGNYELLAQKQLGLVDTALTLDLNFGKNIQMAVPAEEQKNWGNTNYSVQSDLREDKTFRVGF